MNDYKTLEAIPLQNGNSTYAVDANTKKMDLFFDDASYASVEEIVLNPQSYDGRHVADKPNKVINSSSPHIQVVGSNVYLVGKDRNVHLNPRFDLGSLDHTKNASALMKAVKGVEHVVSSKIVAKTELSIVYGAASSGKTLVVLNDLARHITNGAIKGEDVVYVNLDDSAVGLAEKANLLDRLNIKMISEFSLEMLDELVKHGQASGKNFVIDTVKKIVDTMSKSAVADLMKRFKRFTHAGGTVILIAHANKHPNKDGLPILEGVGDFKNDSDCVVRVVRHKDIITMTNEKNRSYVEEEATFQTAETKNYADLFNSVKQLSGQEADDLKQQREQECFKEDSQKLINAITEMIEDGLTQKTKLVNALIADTGHPRKHLVDVLDLLEGDLWEVEKGPNNSKNYSLIASQSLSDLVVSDSANDEKEYLIREGYIPDDNDEHKYAA